METRKFQLAEIARIFRVPLHMIGDLDKSSFSNIEQQSMEFVKYTLEPWVVRWEQALWHALLLPGEQATHFIKFNLDGLLRGDYETRMNGYSTGIQNGFFCPNDVRRMENLNEIPEFDGGDIFMVNVTVIPATIDMHAKTPLDAPRKKRVTGYARVSSGSEEQESSFEAQVDYYTKKIQENPDWIFVGIYADEAISGLSIKNRPGFQNMIADALNGKIDIILTKSVSRLSRNTADNLNAIRALKEKGVEIRFEKENINSLDGQGELLLTIMASLAQEEARSLSLNVTWGQRKRFSDGKVSMPYARFLGYEKGPDGTPKIVESEAKTVRRIYRLYLNGTTVRDICRALTSQGIPTPGGKTQWAVSTVMSILQNEKYAGNALLQKKFTIDYLSKRSIKNEGQVPQYFVTDSHPAIVTVEMFDMVQAEIARNRELGKVRSNASCFSDRVFCGACGEAFGPKTWNSNDKYRRVGVSRFELEASWSRSTRNTSQHVSVTPSVSLANPLVHKALRP